MPAGKTALAQRGGVNVLSGAPYGYRYVKKRLEKGRFRWPQAEAGQSKVVLSQEELVLLLGGIDLVGSKRRAWFRKVVDESAGTPVGQLPRVTTLLQEGIA